MISLYDVHIKITPEGYADFDEVITVQFSEPRHGIYKYIPYTFEIDGKTGEYLFEDLNVEGYAYSTSKANKNLVIRIGDADKYVDGQQIYHVHYRILNPINFFENNQEFYWDIIGHDWDTEIGSVNFHINFPEQVFLKTEDVAFWTGAYGSKDKNANVTVFPREVKGYTTKALLPDEGMTVAINFPKNTFAAMDDVTWFRKRHGLLIGSILFLIAGVAGKVFSRNQKQTIMTEYYPPDGISPAIAGGFVDNSVDNNDVLCLIPHLAAHGYMKLESKPGGFLQRDNMVFTKLKNADDSLFGFEKDFLNGLFSSGDLVELKHLRDRFYTTMNSVKNSVKSWISAQGWYEPDQKTMGCVTALGALGAIGWGAYGFLGQQNTDGIALIAVGILLFVLAGRFHKRSPLGNSTYQKFEGFRQFVAKAEKPVIERLLKDDPSYYDKTMPYALAFGYLSRWNKQFDGLLTQPPSWYSGPYVYGAGGGNPMDSWTHFTETFPTEVNHIGSVFSSSPSSSSSGGGGGGFSGGGGGGGGGGSW